MTFPICGDCPTCLACTRRLLRTPRRAVLPGPPPTAAALERHAARFGPEQVAETAAEYGVSVMVERHKGPTPEQRRARRRRLRA